MAVSARVVGCVVVGLTIGALLTGCQPFEGDEYVVNQAADGGDAVPGDHVCEITVGAGDCSLRAATDEANASFVLDRIIIEPGIDPVAGAFFSIDTSMVIEGNGATVHRAFEHDGGSFDLSDITITGAVNTNFCGGGVLSDGGAVKLTRVRIVGNQDLQPLDGRGSAAVCAAGPLTIVDSVIADNTIGASSNGPTGAIIGHSDIVIANSTVSGNQVGIASGVTGGGVVMPEGGHLVVVQSTITGNAPVTTGAASAIAAPGANGLITLSTLVGVPGGPALSTGPGVSVVGSIFSSATAACAVGGAPTSSGYNVTSDSTCGFGGSGDVVGDPLLGPLVDNGGSTFTRVPAAASPAVDGIPAATATWCDGSVLVDQRGAIRPDGPACDIGSVER